MGDLIMMSIVLVGMVLLGFVFIGIAKVIDAYEDRHDMFND